MATEIKTPDKAIEAAKGTMLEGLAIPRDGKITLCVEELIARMECAIDAALTVLLECNKKSIVSDYVKNQIIDYSNRWRLVDGNEYYVVINKNLVALGIWHEDHGGFFSYPGSSAPGHRNMYHWEKAINLKGFFDNAIL